jgi:hypothetical protein
VFMVLTDRRRTPDELLALPPDRRHTPPLILDLAINRTQLFDR